MRKIFLLLTSVCLLVTLGAEAGGLAAKGWKAGVARRVITPKQSMWMAGFAVRDHPSEGTLHDLWAKALVLEDEEGKQAVLVTTDLLGLPKGISDRIRTRLYTDHKLGKAQIILNSSHTHSGPVLSDALLDIYPVDAEQTARINQYSRFLEEQIVAVVGEALRKTEPARIYAENGVTRFQVNRRNNNAAVLHRLTQLQGPNDYAVPVLKVENEKGELKAVAFGYACHPTVLNGYQWSGDYAGFAQLELEKSHPGVTAMFFQSTGADQNALPRNTIPLAQQYGRELAAAVDRVLDEDMHAIPARLSTAYSEIELPLTAHPDQEGYAKIARETTVDYYRRWANRMAGKLQQGEAMPKTYPYPVQVWYLGDLPLVTLGGEVVVEYAIKLKQILGPSTFVLGYSNDVMAYIPSSTILREGGYEGETSQMVYGLPSTWAPTIETMILYEAVRLARQAGVPTP